MQTILKGYILRLLENDSFKDVYEQSKSFEPKEWQDHSQMFLQKIKDYIDNN